MFILWKPTRQSYPEEPVRGTLFKKSFTNYIAIGEELSESISTNLLETPL
jgi:hypothetical protein